MVNILFYQMTRIFKLDSMGNVYVQLQNIRYIMKIYAFNYRLLFEVLYNDITLYVHLHNTYVWLFLFNIIHGNYDYVEIWSCCICRNKVKYEAAVLNTWNHLYFNFCFAVLQELIFYNQVLYSDRFWPVVNFIVKIKEMATHACQCLKR